MAKEVIANPIVERLKAHWRLKLFLSAAFPVAFWVLYLLAENFPLGPVRPVPLLALDAFFPFKPGAVYLYESLWILQGVAPWLMCDRRQIRSYLLALASVTAVGMIFFVLCPMSCPRPASIDSANALYRGLVRIDNELNAFPSLHAAFAVFSALGCQSVFKSMKLHTGATALVWIWAVGILAATLLTKQHAVVDIVAGSLLGGIGFAFHLRSQRRQFQVGDPVLIQ